MKSDLSDIPLWRLRHMLKNEQAKFDQPKHTKQLPEIAKTCAQLRQEIRNAKQREQNRRSA